MNIASNGIRLHVEDQGEGVLALVFLHGWGGSARTWGHVIAALPPGYRTVALDQRGWGASEHPTSGNTLEELADDTQGAIEALGLERYILVGHSMAAKTVQFLASRRPKGLAGLVLLAPAPPSLFDVAEKVIEGMTDPNIGEFVTYAVENMLTHKPISPADLEMLISDAALGSIEARGAWGRQTSREDITEAVGRINVPTLVIAGEQDKIDTLDNIQRELMSRIPGAVLQVLPEVGHLSLL